MEKIKLISLQNLQLFLTKIQSWINPLLEALNKKIDKKVWTGTKAELETAIAQGLVDASTLIVITDDDEEEIIYQFATLQDIRALFGLS